MQGRLIEEQKCQLENGVTLSIHWSLKMKKKSKEN
jgi:hypothetical protein